MAMGGHRTEEDEALAHNASHSIRDASVVCECVHVVFVVLCERG